MFRPFPLYKLTGGFQGLHVLLPAFGVACDKQCTSVEVFWFGSFGALLRELGHPMPGPAW